MSQPGEIPGVGGRVPADDEPGQRLVTIILTTLNSARFLARSVDSCLAQTHREIELLVVDGGSSDGTLGILGGINDPRLRVIHQTDNAGKLPGALNLGMANAQGEFLTWTQDDSWYEPHAVETMLDYLVAHPAVDLVYTDYWFVDEAGEVLFYQPAKPAEEILGGSDVVGQSFLLRRQVYEAIGPQETRYFPVHEIPWRLKVAERFRIEPLSNPLLYYTVHGESLTGRIGPWQLQYMTAEALRSEGYLSRRAYRRHLARIHIDHAYDEFVLRGDFGAFWRHLPAGIGRDPGWLGNRGLWRLMIRSLLPGRRAYQQCLHARWKAEQAAGLDTLVREHRPRRWEGP